MLGKQSISWGLNSRVLPIIDPSSDSAFIPWIQFLLLSNTCQKCTRCLATLYYWIAYQETLRTTGSLCYYPLDTSGLRYTCSSAIMAFRLPNIPLFFYTWPPTVIYTFINTWRNFSRYLFDSLVIPVHWLFCEGLLKNHCLQSIMQNTRVAGQVPSFQPLLSCGHFLQVLYEMLRGSRQSLH